MNQITRVLAAIPARWNSTRFPGKPLALLGGVPVIVRVARAVLQSDVERPVFVATDDERIIEVVRAHFDASEVEVVMTSPDLPSGSDRLASVVRQKFGPAESWEQRLCVVNVQGDEPFIDPAHISLLARAMREHPDLRMATLGVPLAHASEVQSSNIVKIARASNGRALYFSRAPIPFHRDTPLQQDALNGGKYLRHLGIYAYEASWLLEMAELAPSPLEQAESLEQLRALEHGVDIQVLVVPGTVDIAIDTPQDLERAENWLRQNASSSA
jgi:3-deoxy-manno-octulosonate cytidylyltransferase (CMP-KDO synthetase)